MTTADPFAGIPNASDDEYAGTELETPRQRQRRYAGLVAGTPSVTGCPSCGSEVRAELGLVPGFTGMPVSCSDEWHDEEDSQP